MTDRTLTNLQTPLRQGGFGGVKRSRDGILNLVVDLLECRHAAIVSITRIAGASFKTDCCVIGEMAQARSRSVIGAKLAFETSMQYFQVVHIISRIAIDNVPSPPIVKRPLTDN